MEQEIVFRFKTVQTNAIRILFESLKNILADINFKVDKQGIKLTTVDGTQQAIINLILHGDKFEEYICESELNIGLNLMSVFKILKGIKNTEIRLHLNLTSINSVGNQMHKEKLLKLSFLKLFFDT